MKRGILLIVMLLLLLDLAEDGCFGKVQFVPPSFATKTSLRSLQHYSSGKIDSSPALPSPNWRGMPHFRQSQPIMHMVLLALRLINTCNHGSSGGIPR
jgi:hypothetical protein